MKLSASQALAELYFGDIKNVRIAETLAETGKFSMYEIMKQNQIMKYIRAVAQW